MYISKSLPSVVTSARLTTRNAEKENGKRRDPRNSKTLTKTIVEEYFWHLVKIRFS